MKKADVTVGQEYMWIYPHDAEIKEMVKVTEVRNTMATVITADGIEGQVHLEDLRIHLPTK